MADSSRQIAVADKSDEQARRAELEASQLNQKVLETPRTKEACRRLGLVLEDLHFRPYETFLIPGDLKAKQQLRFDHYEKRRKERLQQVLAERAKVIKQNEKKGEVPGVQSGQFLSMLENLFEKEAKRLEGDLKGQLRQHSSLVKENEEQLRAEVELNRKLQVKDEKRAKAKQHVVAIGQAAKESLDKAFERNSGLIKQQEDDFLQKQLSHAKQMEAEKERMAMWQETRVQASSEKSMLFRERVEKMKVKTAELHAQRKVEGEKKLVELDARIGQVHARREEEQRLRQMRSEEQHLHIMDVRETKDRLDRVDGYRRDELREQIDSNVERIETLLALKDQLLDQRKSRNIKQEANKDARGINLARDCLPGPGTYEEHRSAMHEVPVPKMSKANVPGMVDQAVAKTAKNPAPGAYDSNRLANGAYVEETAPSMAKFSKDDRTSFLDDAMKAKDFVPAPGRYESQRQLDHRAPRIRPDRMSEANQGLDKFSKKRYPIWARPGTDTPGPAGYSVDEYTRKEVLRRAQRSLPNLTRDMLRPGQDVAPLGTDNSMTK